MSDTIRLGAGKEFGKRNPMLPPRGQRRVLGASPRAWNCRIYSSVTARLYRGPRQEPSQKREESWAQLDFPLDF